MAAETVEPAAQSSNNAQAITIQPGTEPPKTSASGNIQQAVTAWRNLGLTGLVTKLDVAAADLVEQQRDSLIQRKDLAQKTKDFRKLEDAVKLQEVKSLLKSYQTFIDVLSKHSQSVSSAFLSAYTPLSEAPDPYPLLEASVESLITAQDVVPRLETDNERLKRDAQNYQNQIEELESQLENSTAARQTLQDTNIAKISEVEQSWTAVLAEKESNWTAREQSLTEKVANQDRLLRELKASYEVSQRLDRAEGACAPQSAPSISSAEADILNSELDKANVRLAGLQSRNEQMRIDLAQANSKAGVSRSDTSIEQEPAFQRLRSENTKLLRRLESAKQDNVSDQAKLETKIRTLERDLTTMGSDCDILRTKVKDWGDYSDIKQELDMIKAIEFSTGDETESFLTSDTSDGKQGESLERLLLARNKKLGNQLTEAQVSHRDIESRLEDLQEELSRSNQDLSAAQKLNATLESDLLRTQQHAMTHDSSAMSVAGTYSSRMPRSVHASRRGGTSPTSSIISGFDGHTVRSLDQQRGGEAQGSGILPMVTAQRDRFKKKISELESELQKTHQTVSSLRSEIASLQRDNLQLYEKTRYVSSYSGQRGGASTSWSQQSSFTTLGPNETNVGQSMDRYRIDYESRISPFAAFKGRESLRVFRRMILPERLVYQITRIVLATRLSRNLFALYCLGLHVMVIMMLSRNDVPSNIPGIPLGSGPLAMAGAQRGELAGAGRS